MGPGRHLAAVDFKLLPTNLFPRCLRRVGGLFVLHVDNHATVGVIFQDLEVARFREAFAVHGEGGVQNTDLREDDLHLVFVG